MPAPAPNRATTNLTLSAGLLSIPLSVYAGVEKDTGIKRAEYDRDGNKVGRVSIAMLQDLGDTHVANHLESLRKKAVTEAAPDFEHVRFYTSHDVLHCVDMGDGLVELTDAEVQTCNPYAGQDKTAQVLCFQPHSVLASGAYLPIGVSQVRPQKSKNGRVSQPNPAAERAFAILLKAMRKHGVFALLRIISGNQPTYGALLPTGRLYNLAFDEQIREDLPLGKPDLDPTQVRMAETLVESMIEEQPRVLENEITPKVVEYLDKKLAEGKVVKLTATAPASTTAGVGDLMAQLTASVEAAKAKS